MTVYSWPWLIVGILCALVLLSGLVAGVALLIAGMEPVSRKMWCDFFKMFGLWIGCVGVILLSVAGFSYAFMGHA